MLFQTIQKKKYSPRTVQLILKKAAKKAGITRRVHCHLLRHCFATHLIESGTDIRIVKKLLGHSNLKTTIGYYNVPNLKVDNVKSPLQ